MRAGKLDRRITLQQASEASRDAMNAPVYTWSTFATVWAQLIFNRGDERFAAHEVAGASVVTFKIRYRSGVTDKLRISYDGKIYDIRDVRELGRQDGLELDAVARSDG